MTAIPSAAWEQPGEGAGPNDAEPILFRRLGERDELPPGQVHTIVQDRQATIWIATENGVASFDKFRVERYLESEAIAGDYRSFAAGENGWLWLGTGGNGLIRFNHRTGARSWFRHRDGRLSNDGVHALHRDLDGAIWAGTDAGLNRLDRENLEFEFQQLPGGNAAPAIRAIHAVELPRLRSAKPASIHQARTLWAGTAADGLFRTTPAGTWKQVWNAGVEISAIAHRTAPDEWGAPQTSIWVGTRGAGIFVLGTDGRVIEKFENEFCLDVRSLAVDDSGIVWIGSPAGLARYDPVEIRWNSYRSRLDDPASIGSGAIGAIFEDRGSGVLWTGAESGVVSIHSLDRSWFARFRSDAHNPDSLIGNSIWGAAQTSDGAVWIGTDSGLERFDPRSGRFTHFQHDPADPSSLPRGSILAVHADREDRVWLGMRAGGGLTRFDPQTGEFTTFRHDPADSASLPADSITAIAEDRSGRIWVGLLGHGLACFEAETGNFAHFPGHGEQLLGTINDLVEDRAGRIWVATVGGGLWRFFPATGEFEPALAGGPANLVSLNVDKNDTVWIGSVGGGLGRFDPSSGRFEAFTKTNSSLPHWSVFETLTDDEGRIWASTGAGLSRFDPEAGKFQHFTRNDGLQAGAFHPKAALRLADGRLLFGGSNGFNLIDPTDTPKPVRTPLPILTSLRLFGDPVEVDPDGILKKPLNVTGELNLPHDPQLRFSIQFGTLDYASGNRGDFRYRLEGAEDRWIEGGPAQSASYFGLKPGSYEFRVETTSDGRNWHALPRPLTINIVPPWYRTGWAITLFVLAGGGLISLTLVLVLRNREARQREVRIRLKNERNQAEAALARQMQQSMLTESTAAEFRRSPNAHHVFSKTLERIAESFSVRHSLVAACEPGSGIRVLAEHLDANESGRGPEISGQLLDRVLESERAVVVHEGGDLTRPTLAVRTTHFEKPNGMVVLQDWNREAHRVWQAEEVALLEAVGQQLGLAIAQFVLSEEAARQRLEIEEARQAADSANQAKSEFLARMTHEVRTPLNAIIGFSDLICREHELEAEVRRQMEIISASGEHLLSVINDVLEAAKIEEGKAELVEEEFELENLFQSVRGMLSVRAEEKGLALEAQAMGDLPDRVRADKGKLRQILINLIGNAIKFTERGSITLRSSADWADSSDSDPSNRPVTLIVEVIDTGAGIAEAEIGKLFEKFAQTETGRRSHQGTGLGLSIVKSFVELMNGRIDVASKEGSGTCFTLRIPLVEVINNVKVVQFNALPAFGQQLPEAGGPVRMASAEAPRGEVIGLDDGHREVRVLVVEDQPLNRMLMRKLLEPAGFTVIEAEDGQVAVENWAEWQPDIIFMDEDMPRLCGSEATRQITAAGGGSPPPIVSLTAFALDDQRAASREAGAVDFLPKPFQREELFEKIEKFVRVQFRYKSAA